MYSSRAASILRSRVIMQQCSAARMQTRLIHSSPVAQKTVTEKVSEVADKVNKKVGQGLAGAIDKGEKATYAAKDSMDSVTKDTEKKAEETATKAKHKANQVQSGAREAKQDFEKEVRK